MSTTVFDFLVAGDFSYPNQHQTRVTEGNFGVAVTQPEHGIYGLYRCSFTVVLPGKGPSGTVKTLSDWAAFDREIRGGYDSFLFKDRALDLFRKSTGEALGTGTGTATDFALDFRHVDSATLLVYKDGVLQTSGYSLVNNNTAPVVRFTSAPSNGVVITATYEWFMPVRFDGDPGLGEFLGSVLNFDATVDLVEIYSGAHRVSA